MPPRAKKMDQASLIPWQTPLQTPAVRLTGLIETENGATHPFLGRDLIAFLTVKKGPWPRLAI